MTYMKLNTQIMPNKMNWRPGGSRVPNTEEEFPIWIVIESRWSRLVKDWGSPVADHSCDRGRAEKYSESGPTDPQFSTTGG